MKCTNCGASIPRDAGACPQCGVFARLAEPPRKGGSRRWILVLLLLAAAAGGATYFLTRGPAAPPAPLPIRVVHDRPGGAHLAPGATVSEPEAILRLRRSLALAPDCVAIMSHGFVDGGYRLTAVNRCDGTRLGRWRVDGRSGAVVRDLGAGGTRK